MAALSHSVQCHSGGCFLIPKSTPEEVFTREDLSAAQKMLGSVAEDWKHFLSQLTIRRLTGPRGGAASPTYWSRLDDIRSE